MNQIKDIEHIINKYKELKLDGVSFPKLFVEIQKDFNQIPFTTAILKKGTIIDRARLNDHGQIFNSEKELSYRTDIPNLVKFGRANVPHSSMFYGSIPTKEIEYPRIVNLIETEETFRKELTERENKSFYMTVGKWKLMQDIEILEVVFSKIVRGKSSKIQASYEKHIEKLKSEHPENYEYFIKVLEFFSDEFSKQEINNHEDYKISAAYMEMGFHAGFSGILYPSVRTEYMGANVALSIDLVEKFLQMEKAGMFRIDISGDNVVVSNAAIASDLGPLNSAFKWEKSQKLTEEQISELLLK